MPATNAVWGIDIGQCALKAIKLRPGLDGKIEAVAFDLIEHPKILSQPDADRDELVRAALEKFVSRNDFQGDRFVVGVAGQQTFARFCKLPPVDPKKIPDIVRFEASQQIPFDMDDVVWDYQVFQSPESPDVEVGIFAIRKDLIRKQIDFLGAVGVAPSAVQTVPSALFNFCRFDQQEPDEEGATVVIDVGAQNTDLVIVEAHSAWTRNIPLGGNSFTEALIKSFKLSFAKAESLKRSAATSKYARQIFQAMRPVFAELVAEIQRSIGFYSSTHRDVELKRVLALGNAFRLPGLQKYLANNLTFTGGVVKLEKFSRLAPSATINAPQFQENILSFGTAYGLALRELGLAEIKANLLPPELARVAVWKKKRPWFAAAAACLALAAVAPWARNFTDKAALASADDPAQRETAQIIRQAQAKQTEFNQVKLSDTSGEQRIQKLLGLQKDKRLIPSVLALVHGGLPELDPAIAAARSADELKKAIADSGGRLARTNRRQILLDVCKVDYKPNIDSFVPASAGRTSDAGVGVAPGLTGGGRGRGLGPQNYGEVDMYPQSEGDQSKAEAPGFYVYLQGRVLFGADRSQAAALLTEEYYPNLLRLGQQAGLGFYVPLKDPKARNEQNFSAPIITKYYESAQGGAQGPGPGNMMFPAGRGARTPGGQTFQPGLAAPGANPEDAGKMLDPVTGEDMATDWRFEFGFKIKLGEKPAEESEAGSETGD